MENDEIGHAPENSATPDVNAAVRLPERGNSEVSPATRTADRYVWLLLPTTNGYSSRLVSFKVAAIVPNTPESMIALQPPSATLRVNTSNGVRRSDEYSRICAQQRESRERDTSQDNKFKRLEEELHERRIIQRATTYL